MAGRPVCTVRPLRPRDVPAVRRLLQLYIYDLGGDRWGVNADGSFGSPGWHRRFWRRRGKHHYVVRVGRQLAGFALVDERARFAGVGTREIAEFFVLRRYRRRGVGIRTARELFARFPGRWELAVLSWNVGAQRFWRGVIRRSARGPVSERRRRAGDLTFVVHQFEARAARRLSGRRRSAPRRPASGRRGSTRARG
jgi:predicted acetyltransferase